MTRCPERTRTEQGWLRCHDDSGHAGPHHAGDRSWLPLRFTPPCDCAGDDLIVYFGGVPMTVQGVTKSSWPTPWHGTPA